MRLLIIIFTILIYLQYKTTDPISFTKQTEIEQITQQQRMDQYPNYAYRLANIIEARPEFRTYFKLENNFINIFDLNKFNNYLTIIFLPIFIFGYINLIQTKTKFTVIATVIPIILLSIIGQQNKFGSFILYPIIFSSITFGIYKIIYAK